MFKVVASKLLRFADPLSLVGQKVIWKELLAVCSLSDIPFLI